MSGLYWIAAAYWLINLPILMVVSRKPRPAYTPANIVEAVAVSFATSWLLIEAARS